MLCVMSRLPWAFDSNEIPMKLSSVEFDHVEQALRMLSTCWAIEKFNGYPPAVSENFSQFHQFGASIWAKSLVIEMSSVSKNEYRSRSICDFFLLEKIQRSSNLNRTCTGITTIRPLTCNSIQFTCGNNNKKGNQKGTHAHVDLPNSKRTHTNSSMHACVCAYIY